MGGRAPEPPLYPAINPGTLGHPETGKCARPFCNPSTAAQEDSQVSVCQ